MANLYAVPAGESIAECAAAHLLANVPRAQWPETLLLLPTRRACVAMRQAFLQALEGVAALLPRMVPFAELDRALLTLLDTDTALTLLESIPPAMPDWQQRYLLATQTLAFERRRMGAASIADALALAEDLMALRDDCARAGVALTPQALRPLTHRDVAAHHDAALEFLRILSEHWPEIERAHGLTIAAHREVQVLEALATRWEAHAPAFPVVVIGSTASQEATARLLTVIAKMPHGSVILPGLDTDIPDQEWQRITAGHPMFHVKHFLDRLRVGPATVKPLKNHARSIWQTALAATEQLPHWAAQPLPGYDHLRIIPCQHAEEEARVVALLLREGLERTNNRTALVTPDEGFMARVAAHLQRFGITADRLSAGTLAMSETGSLWMAVAQLLTAPDRLLPLRHLLHHPLLAMDRGLLRQMEPYWYGVSTHRPGQLPRMPEALRHHDAMPAIETLAAKIARLSARHLTAEQWLESITELLAPITSRGGEEYEAVEEALAALAHAQMLGPMDAEAFCTLLTERLSAPRRNAGIATHPQIAMLTPVEARLQQFDRVVLANMQDAIWPGLPAPNAWLNLAAQQTLGLPSPQERASLMAHDVLMLASAREVFLTYPRRDGGSPATRSRFIERLVTLLAAHGIGEETITARKYVEWANALDAADVFQPEPPVMPRPTAAERPRSLKVTDLNRLFSDPFEIYAREVLALRPYKDIDAELEASDFGTLAHKAIHALSEYWDAEARPADAAEIGTIADHALRAFSERPNVALFWRMRLIRALEWVNAHEEQRRASSSCTIRSEWPIERAIRLNASESMPLRGTMDRLEEGRAIVDYKTGTAPELKAIREGRDVQLLAYAMLLAAGESGAPSLGGVALEYWTLPHGRKAGEITRVEAEELEAAGIPQTLCAALADFLNPQTPLLACPSGDTNRRYGNDFDGISRYDEWAG